MPHFEIRNDQFSMEELELAVREAVANALDLDVDDVAIDASLQHDLDAESLDYLDIAFALERRFRVRFPREDLLNRAGELFGETNLVVDGTVTPLGLEILAAAAPELPRESLVAGLRAMDVPGLFKVETFVRVLDRLLAAKQRIDRKCPQCGQETKESSSLPELVCPACETTVPLPSGDDVMLSDLEPFARRAKA